MVNLHLVNNPWQVTGESDPFHFAKNLGNSENSLTCIEVYGGLFLLHINFFDQLELFSLQTWREISLIVLAASQILTSSE